MTNSTLWRITENRRFPKSSQWRVRGITPQQFDLYRLSLAREPLRRISRCRAESDRLCFHDAVQIHAYRRFFLRFSESAMNRTSREKQQPAHSKGERGFPSLTDPGIPGPE